MLFWINSRQEFKFRRLFHKPSKKWIGCPNSLPHGDFFLSWGQCKALNLFPYGAIWATYLIPLTMQGQQPSKHLNFRKIGTFSKNLIIWRHCDYLVKYLLVPKGKYFRFLCSKKLGWWEPQITVQVAADLLIPAIGRMPQGGIVGAKLTSAVILRTLSLGKTFVVSFPRVSAREG